MAVSRIRLEVEGDDGEIVTVVADQRDLAKLEAKLEMSAQIALRDRRVTAVRVLAHSALQRTGLVDAKTSFDSWSATVPGVEWEVVDPADPGHPEAPDGSRSSSPSRRARASGKSSSTGNPAT